MCIVNGINRYGYLIVSCLVVLLLHGCGSPKLEPIGPDGTILAFGDSLTAGVGVSKEFSYPAVLSELTGLNVINSGLPGETTIEGVKRLESELDRSNPNLVILIEGGNDILRNFRSADIKANLAKMIELVQSREIPIVLIGIPKKALFSDSAHIYEELAEQYQLVFHDDLIADLQRSLSLKSDLVHFNKAGYRKMAEEIYALLADNGAL